MVKLWEAKIYEWVAVVTAVGDEDLRLLTCDAVSFGYLPGFQIPYGVYFQG
jgi:hypothetical protein